MPNLEVVIARLIFAENVFFASEQLNIKRNAQRTFAALSYLCAKRGS